MKKCYSCGNLVDDSAQFCARCGASFTNPNQSSPVGGYTSSNMNPAQNQPVFNTNSTIKKISFKDKKVIAACIGAAVAFVAIIIAIIIIINANSYMSPVKNFEKGYNSKNYTKIVKCFFPKKLIYNSDAVDDFVIDASDLADFGNIKINVIAKNKTPMSDLYDYNKYSIVNNYGIIYTKGYDIYTNVTTTTMHDVKSQNIVFHVGKYKNHWYIINWDY